MQRIFCVIWISLFLLGFGSNLMGQSKQGNTASHRRIPLSDGRERPKLESFLPPNHKQFRQEYLELQRRKRQAQRSQRNPLRGQPTDGERLESPIRRNGDEPTERSWFDTGFRPSGEQPGMGFDSDPLENIRRFGQSIGETISEWQNPGSVNRNREQYVAEEYPRQYREARRKFRDALNSFRQSWPDDRVAPQEWLEKVQPFIDPEMLGQIIEARRQFDAQTDRPPNERRFQNLSEFPFLSDQDGSKSNSLIDSMMKSLDKKSTSWLKSTERKKSTIWKSLSKSARQGLANLNQKMTANSKERARANSKANSTSLNAPRPSQASPTTATSPSQSLLSRASTPSSSPATKPPALESRDGNWLWIVGSAFVVIATSVYLMRHRLLVVWHHSRTDLGHVSAERIHDHDSLLKACHSLALALFGFRSRFWNHRKLFQSLAEQLELDDRGQVVNSENLGLLSVGSADRAQRRKKAVVGQLSSLYEQARYSPRKLLDSELDHARELFVSLQRHLQTES